MRFNDCWACMDLVKTSAINGLVISLNMTLNTPELGVNIEIYPSTVKLMRRTGKTY